MSPVLPYRLTYYLRTLTQCIAAVLSVTSIGNLVVPGHRDLSRTTWIRSENKANKDTTPCTKSRQAHVKVGRLKLTNKVPRRNISFSDF
ncbi:hypothetical protein IQ07DRAFT_382232 [Pyrenochaeta sp. DS3sAY3a]|nr:hypothetical protein IQ07DRAFT_382232 [Pyrenochaeta sp. DS3sAY3a]